MQQHWFLTKIIVKSSHLQRMCDYQHSTKTLEKNATTLVLNQNNCKKFPLAAYVGLLKYWVL
jgi:hypothetical protein